MCSRGVHEGGVCACSNTHSAPSPTCALLLSPATPSPHAQPWKPDAHTSVAHRTICTPTLSENTRQWRAACVRQRNSLSGGGQSHLRPSSPRYDEGDEDGLGEVGASAGAHAGLGPVNPDSPQPGGSTPRAVLESGGVGLGVGGGYSPPHSFTGTQYGGGTVHDSGAMSIATTAATNATTHVVVAATGAAWLRASHPEPSMANGHSRRSSAATATGATTPATAPPSVALSTGSIPGGLGFSAGGPLGFTGVRPGAVAGGMARHTRHLSRGHDDLPLPSGLGIPSPNPWLPLPSTLPLPRIREPSEPSSTNPFAPRPGEEDAEGPSGGGGGRGAAGRFVGGGTGAGAAQSSPPPLRLRSGIESGRATADAVLSVGTSARAGPGAGAGAAQRLHFRHSETGTSSPGVSMAGTAPVLGHGGTPAAAAVGGLGAHGRVWPPRPSPNSARHGGGGGNGEGGYAPHFSQGGGQGVGPRSMDGLVGWGAGAAAGSARGAGPLSAGAKLRMGQEQSSAGRTGEGAAGAGVGGSSRHRSHASAPVALSNADSFMMLPVPPVGVR